MKVINPIVVQVLLDHSPGLLNTFVSAPALLSRATTANTGGQALVERLYAMDTQDRNTPVIVEQGQLFEQYAQFLQALARRHPVLMTLDDLQSADNGSINLLFHLSRRQPGASSSSALTARMK